MSIEFLSKYGEAAQRGYKDLVKLLDTANKALISPRKISNIGGFVLDLETDIRKTKSLNATNKVVEAGYSIVENAVHNLATIQLSGVIADYAFTPPENAFGKASDVVAEIGKRVKMVGGYFLNDLWPEQMNTVNTAIAKTENALNIASQKWEMAKSWTNGTNEILGGSLSRTQKILAQLEALFDIKAQFEFACEFAYYPSMFITHLSIGRSGVQSGVITINMTLQEYIGAKMEVAQLDTAQFAQNLCRTDIQALTPENRGEQKVDPRTGFVIATGVPGATYQSTTTQKAP